MNLTFNPIPMPERVIVRDDDRYVGMLVRYPGGPVWADQDLRKALGAPLTEDGGMALAEGRVRHILGAC